jgi:NAD(P)-dependent dehydrogenase (short-subunit alcohol dehydrogenase family)
VGDVQKREHVAAMADAALRAYGAVDILVNNVGDYLAAKPVRVDGGTYAAGGWYRTALGGWTNSPLNP